MKVQTLLLACICFALNGALKAQNLEGTCWSASTCNPTVPLETCFENDTMTTIVEPDFTFYSHYGTLGDSIFWVLDITQNCPDTGFYNYETLGNMLTFTLIEDDCAPRVESMINCFEYFLLKVGINENEVFLGLIIYPNPVQNFFSIENPATIDMEVRLLDELGRVVLETRTFLEKTVIAVDHLSNGIYTLILKNGDQMRSNKVLILK